MGPVEESGMLGFCEVTTDHADHGPPLGIGRLGFRHSEGPLIVLQDKAVLEDAIGIRKIGTEDGKIDGTEVFLADDVGGDGEILAPVGVAVANPFDPSCGCVSADKIEIGCLMGMGAESLCEVEAD